VKKLDTAGSLRLSEDFVGKTSKSGSSGGSGGSGGKDGSPATTPLRISTSPTKLTEGSPTSSGHQKHRNGKLRKEKDKSSAAVAGLEMVSEVIIPTLDKVSVQSVRVPIQITHSTFVGRLYVMIWTREKSNL
jgi:hypothetical protein